jgi:deoxycytidine triphosphate deaminase
MPGIKNDEWIKHMARKHKMIEPFAEKLVRKGKISYPLTLKIYANEGIAQVIFLEADEPCKISYADRKGKYQGQKGITLPKVDK